MKIAIVGSGISGLTTAYLLRDKHRVTLFEKNDYIGGHTATKKIEFDGKLYNIDTGFIVYNDWTYPKFISLLDELGVKSQETLMGFSVFDHSSDFQYSGENLSGLFSDRKQIFSLQHWRMLRDILRFNRQAVRECKEGKLDESESLGDYLARNKYSDAFKERYLVPMGAAIWSTCFERMLAFPALFFIRFFHNHGLLSVSNRPTWRVIRGGSKEYVAPLLKKLSASVRLGESVHSVKRDEKGVSVLSDAGTEEFDAIVFACHSDEALSLLDAPTDTEAQVLGAIQYQESSVVLHTDTAWLPSKKRSWASWNYRLDLDRGALPVVTYNMNILQGINAPPTFCVTLNAEEHIDQEKILGRYRYAHPQFDLPAAQAQQRWAEISGSQHTWYAGAYWFNGFHEDGVKSAERVAQALGGARL